MREPMLQTFAERKDLSQTYFALTTKTRDDEGFMELERELRRCREEVQARHPSALAGWQLQVVRMALLQARIAHYMVPTWVESFALTVAIIFVAFLLVFRSGAPRIMAMIPSVFTMKPSLRHMLLIAGRAIFFETLEPASSNESLQDAIKISASTQVGSRCSETAK